VDRDPNQPRTSLLAEAGVRLPRGWSADVPAEADVAELTELVRRHEVEARGWAGASERYVLVEIGGDGSRGRRNIVVRDPGGAIRGWASARDRAAGRMLLVAVVDPRLEDAQADTVAAALFGWAVRAARRVGRDRGLSVQQIDSGAFAGDERQHRWLRNAGFEKVRTWWQMSRPVTPADARTEVRTGAGVRIRRVRRVGSGMPDEQDLRVVHHVLESAFADHFNSHEETFDEFVSRLREDPGHRWDHWWIAELVDAGADGKEGAAEPAGALVGSVSEAAAGDTGERDGSYVEYIGVLQNARGRGVATSLLNTVIADAAANGRDRVGLEVDADSPTGAEGLYLSMGWTTQYVTESWHRNVPVAAGSAEQ
jgi:ribosomal protein S18 acetylase RimI-like enzyme